MVHQHPLPEEIAVAILATERMPGFERTLRSNLRTLVRLRGARPEVAVTDAQLTGVSQSSLLVFSRSHPMGAERAARRMEQALRRAELHMVEGGHPPWLTEPERIASLINPFLHEHGRTPARSQSLRRSVD